VIKKIIAIVLVIIIAAAAVVFYLLRQQEAARAASMYKIGSVTKSDIPDIVSTTGTLKSQNSFSQIIDTGLVTKLDVKLGDTVKTDDEIGTVRVASATSLTGTKDVSILAGADGTITQLNIAEGESYTGLMAALVIEDLNSQKVEVRLSKNDSYKISTGQSATITVNGKEYDGTVDTVSPTATQFQTVQGVEASLVVDIKLSSYIPDVKIGFDVDCDILLEELKGVLVVPLQAVVANTDASTHIFSVENGKAIDNIVKLGLVSGSNVQILDGVTEGEKIVLNPKPILKDGDRVIEDTSK